ncbi:MAG: SDR family NAD(P)-dependent oxidoreductase [Myxococcota bacterium]
MVARPALKDWLRPGHTAVVTGGASGIGYAAGVRFAAEGMNVLLADVDEAKLMAARDRLAATGARVEAAACDVSVRADFERLRDRAYAAFGAVHCVMNNAGAGFRMDDPWADQERAERTLAINLWGVIHGCQAFVPAMLEGGAPGAIVNTGSKQGITRPPGNWAYNLSKAGVLAYTESVAHALRKRDGRLSAHLLIPGFVYTGMIDRPEKPPGAWTADETVAFMIERLAEDDFYVLCPDAETPRALDEKRIQWTADDLIRNRPALSRWHPDHAEAFRAFVEDA